MTCFNNRHDAGKQLSQLLLKECAGQQGVVYALPRGGVPLAVEVGQALGLPVELVITRKIGHPHNAEYAICAISESGALVCNEEEQRRVPAEWLARRAREERAEAGRRRRVYRGGEYISATGKLAIVVDDGVATGLTMLAALRELRRQEPARLIAAVPVAPREVVDHLLREADAVITVAAPEFYLGAVSAYYRDFPQLSDEEVLAELGAAPHHAQEDVMIPDVLVRAVRLDIEGVRLPGILATPVDATGLVVFAHGSGSSRLSPRNQAVAEVLQEQGLATLLFDLLTPEEDSEPEARFDIPRLARRLEAVAAWAARAPATQGLRLGFFGASTGAAAALMAAAARPDHTHAVVSRGGRPDLAGGSLKGVRAPTLFIVGGDDEPVLSWNREAYAQLAAEKDLEVIPGATHLFEEAGAMEQVCALAAEWFARHLTA